MLCQPTGQHSFEITVILRVSVFLAHSLYNKLKPKESSNLTYSYNINGSSEPLKQTRLGFSSPQLSVFALSHIIYLLELYLTR